MTISGTGKVTRNRGSMLIPIPAPIAKDSQMPFAVGDEVSVTIDGDKVIIKKNIDCIEVAGEKMHVGDLIRVVHNKAHLAKSDETPTHIISSIEGDNRIMVAAFRYGEVQ